MEAVQTAAQKSTTDRPISQQQLRWLMAGLNAVSPSFAARLADRLFFTPRRFARPAWEQQLLTQAEPLTLRHDKVRVPAYSWGAGPTVLLVHGWEGRGTQMGGFVPALVAAGYRAVAVDLPGHGAAADARTSVYDFARALTSVVAQLGPLSAVVSHSAGAGASVLAHSMKPFDARLVLLAPPRGPRTFFDQFVAYAGMSEAATRLFEARMTKRFGRSIDSLDVSVYAPSVTLPTLVIHDRADKDVPYAHGKALSELLPNAQLITTEGLGHRRILRDPSVVEQSLAFIAARRGEAAAQ